VRDQDQLKVALVGTGRNNVSQRQSQSFLVVVIEVHGRFVKSNAAAVYAERFRESQTNDNASKDTLPRTAAATHIHLSASFRHNDAVIVGFGSFRPRFGSTLDLNVCDVLAFVSEQPKFADDAIDLADLDSVELKQCLSHMQNKVVLDMRSEAQA